MVTRRRAPKKEPACRICGCTENHACAGGCYWVEPDVCSECQPMALLTQLWKAIRGYDHIGHEGSELLEVMCEVRVYLDEFYPSTSWREKHDGKGQS